MQPKQLRPLHHYILPALFVGALFFQLVNKRPSGPQSHAFRGHTMGTTWHVKLVADPAMISVQKVRKAVSEAMEEVNQRMSTYIADSEVCLLYTSPSPRDAHESRMPSSA